MGVQGVVPLHPLHPFIQGARVIDLSYSTVTDFAKFLGWSTSNPLRAAM